MTFAVGCGAAGSRGLSKEPSILHSMHTYFAQCLPFLEETSIVIDGDSRTLDEVVVQVLALLSTHCHQRKRRARDQIASAGAGRACRSPAASGVRGHERWRRR